MPPSPCQLQQKKCQAIPLRSKPPPLSLCPFGFISYRIDIAPENTLWVGAWWIGFLGAGAASLLISIPILGYPQRLPGTWPERIWAALGLTLGFASFCIPVAEDTGQRKSFQCLNFNSYMDFTPVAFQLPVSLLLPCRHWQREDVTLYFPPASPPFWLHLHPVSHMLLVPMCLSFSGSQRYIVMRVSEAHQLKDGSHKKASDPDFGKTVKDLPR